MQADPVNPAPVVIPPSVNVLDPDSYAQAAIRALAQALAGALLAHGWITSTNATLVSGMAVAVLGVLWERYHTLLISKFIGAAGVMPAGTSRTRLSEVAAQPVAVPSPLAGLTPVQVVALADQLRPHLAPPVRDLQ